MASSVLKKMKTSCFAFALVALGIPSCDKIPQNSVGNAREETIIKRELVSNTWNGEIEYTYGPDGRLRRAYYELQAKDGRDMATLKDGPTKCIRKFEVSSDGEMRQTSKVTTDVSSGTPVERVFGEPVIRHPMTLAKARNCNLFERTDAAAAMSGEILTQ